jgi:hypothetical protein
MNTLTRWQPIGEHGSLQDQVNQLLEDSISSTGCNSSLTPWSPAVAIRG